jgi:serine/threonine protein kinase
MDITLMKAAPVTEDDVATCVTTDELPSLGGFCTGIGSSSSSFKRSVSDTDSENELQSASRQTTRSPESLKQDIDSTISSIAEGVKPWVDSGLETVRTLQMAPRNKGQVDLMRSVSEGHFVAVKRMPNSWVRENPDEFDKHSGGSLELPWFDIGLNANLSAQGFQYVCKPLGVFRDEEFTYVASSFASGGDLFGLMDRDPSPGEAREKLIHPIMFQVFTAVRWLHDHGVAHCDLSLENILLTGEDEKTVKLIDFGMATTSRSCLEGCGKKSYIAPEMFQGSYNPFMSDNFALGVVLYSLAARAYPWNSTRPGSCRLFDFVCSHGLRAFLARRKVWKGNGKALAQVFGEPLVCLIAGLLDMDPGTRLTLGERSLPKERATVWESMWMQYID